MKQTQDEMRGDIEALKRGQDELRDEVKVLRRGQDKLSRGQDQLRGHNYERRIQFRADAIFGYFLKRGRNRRNQLGNYLEEAEEKGQISAQEHIQVLASDLLWGGKLKTTKAELFLVVEVSHKAENEFSTRDLWESLADLKTVGEIGRDRRKKVTVLAEPMGVVAGINWESGLRDKALNKGVVIVTDLQMDKDSWLAAISKANVVTA